MATRTSSTTRKSKKKAPLTVPFLVLVLDETGSMEPKKDATIDAFNEYLAAMKTSTPTAMMSIYKFSLLHTFGASDLPPSYRTLAVNVPITQIEPLTEDTYTPDGSTPLLDAVGHAITQTARITAARHAISMVILTDGQENSSTEYTKDSLKALITEKTNAGWTFVYLGENQDAWAEAHAIGIPRGNATPMTYTTPDQTKNTMRNLATAHSGYTSQASAGVGTSSFFEDAGQTADDYMLFEDAPEPPKIKPKPRTK